jgi:saccharopine dehydrogenase-like NADP-dependent oxidoreductase
MAGKCAVVLGGYGNFGRLIVAALAADREHRVIVAGRDARRARAAADAISAPVEPAVLDAHAANFAAELRRLGADVVVHAAGPFQGQDYSVPRACIEARTHYVDLADARSYVCGIQTLNEPARCNDVLVVSGASSVPALSSAVVDRLQAEFSIIESIEHGITSGARPPGLAAMEGVLSYVGKPIRQWRDLEQHREVQRAGRAGIFEEYRIRVASVIRDYGLDERAEAPKDSLAAHRKEGV